MELLIEVHGNESELVLVKGVDDEVKARRVAYEAMFGTPEFGGEVKSDEEIAEHTTVRYVHQVSV